MGGMRTSYNVTHNKHFFFFFEGFELDWLGNKWRQLASRVSGQRFSMEWLTPTCCSVSKLHALVGVIRACFHHCETLPGGFQQRITVVVAGHASRWVQCEAVPSILKFCRWG